MNLNWPPKGPSTLKKLLSNSRITNDNPSGPLGILFIHGFLKGPHKNCLGTFNTGS